jgi:hypothetical protein
MQQARTYASGKFKREACYQFEKDLKKMTKHGWHVLTVTDEGIGTGSAHTGCLKVVYENKEKTS